MPPTLSLCDRNHRAVAFLGVCPVCHLRTDNGKAPLEGNTHPHRHQLDAALREAYRPKLSQAFLDALGDTLERP